jgi:predicted TIM-barrel fold metal-dependent hydrolase
MAAGNGSFKGEPTVIDINTCFGFNRWKRMDASVEMLLAQIKKHGIGKALTYSLRGVYYDCREGNAETLEVCGRYECLLPVAVFDPRAMLNIEDEASMAASLGFKAVRIFPEEQGWSVASVAFNKLLAAINANNLPLITSVPPTSLYDQTPGISIPVVFLAVHYYRLYEALAVFADRPNFFAETRQLLSPDALELFARIIGANRLLFGTNLPFDYAGSPLERLRSADISQAERAMIASGNACRIFGIGREGA